MSDGTHGHGTTLAGATAGTVGNVTNLSNSQTRDSIDISTMDSTSKFREFIAGMADAGELTFTINYDGDARKLGSHDADVRSARQSVGMNNIGTKPFQQPRKTERVQYRLAFRQMQANNFDIIAQPFCHFPF